MFIILTTTYQNGRATTQMAERDLARVNKTDTLTDILHAQVENVSHVFEANQLEDTFRDVSEDMARELAGLAMDRDDVIPAHLRDFIDTQLGIGSCDEIEAETTGRSNRAEHGTYHGHP